MRKVIRTIVSYSLILAFLLGLMPLEVVAEESEIVEKQVITGFEALSDSEQSFIISISDKPSLEELVSKMPKTLEVHIGEGTETIDVTWESVGEDYEASDRFYFQFSPVWDETKYSLSEELNLIQDAPYISIFLYDVESGVSPNAVTSSSNETTIFNFLVTEMGFNNAAASGILANIYHESSFNPNVTGDNGTSYGICQWHDSRWESMKTWCTDNGYDWTTLIGQLYYLKAELTQSGYLWNGKTIYNYISAVENTEQGAYDAGYYWCYYYEVPANKETVAVTRGNLAKDTYWPEYCDEQGSEIGGDGGNNSSQTEIDILNYSVPSSIVTGKAFTVKGTVNSANALTNVSVGCYDVDGNMLTGASASPYTTTYNLANLDYYVEFNLLDPGVYFYKITASDSLGAVTLVNKAFVVLAKSQTITEGNYVISPSSDSNYAIQVSDKSDSSGANVELQKKANSAYQTLKITYAESGYYTLQFVGSENLLTVASSSAEAGTNVQQEKAADASTQKWQILPVGNAYCLVPMNATSLCLNISGNAFASGVNVEINTPSISEFQCFSLTESNGSYSDDQNATDNPFTDVSSSDYYYDAVLWAYNKGITSGKDETHFQPSVVCTRAQAVTFLWRSQGEPEPTTTSNPFVDVSTSDYYYKAVLWAYEKGITLGKDETHFQPDATVNRAQVVTFLWRAEGQPSPSGSNPFTDVSSSDYFYKAVLWAYENNITQGKDETHFQPDDNCIRGQVVTFLYRTYN